MIMEIRADSADELNNNPVIGGVLRLSPYFYFQEREVLLMLDSMARLEEKHHLQDSNDYAAYFQHLNRVFAFLVTWYQKLVEGGNTEAKIVKIFLEKFLATVRVLRFKFLYAQDSKLTLDLHDSGFPHWTDIFELESDLALQSERRKQLPSRRIVQEIMLESMLTRGEIPADLLSQMSQIQLGEELDGSRLIFTFTPGDLTIIQNGSETDGVLNCLFSWLCYNKISNRPCIYVMAFDFKGSQEELLFEFNQGDFIPAIRRVGDRVPPLAVLATDIDQSLLKVFPKILKRIEIGPIICPKFSVPGDQEQLVEWLTKFGEPEDFALLLETGVIFSRGEFQEKQGWLSLSKSKVRQIFAISEDVLASERQATQVQQVVMLPHQVLQQINTSADFEKLFGPFTKVSYNSQGGIYVV